MKTNEEIEAMMAYAAPGMPFLWIGCARETRLFQLTERTDVCGLGLYLARSERIERQAGRALRIALWTGSELLAFDDAEEASFVVEHTISEMRVQPSVSNRPSMAVPPAIPSGIIRFT